MTLSDISIKNRVFAWMLMLGLILFGAISFFRMGISEMPDADFPVVSVQVDYEGASAEIMDTDVVDLVEQAVMTVTGIRGVSSSSRQEEAHVTIEFDLDRDIDAAVQEVQTKISQIRKQLPEDIDPPIVTKTNPEDHPIMWVSLSAEKPLREIMEYARDNLKDQLQTVAGVGEVILGGYVAPVLRVWIDPEKLSAAELTVEDVLNAIRTQHREIPAGRLETFLREINLRAYGETFTTEDFSKIRIPQRGGRPIFTPLTIGDVARVEKGLDDIRRISRTDGKPAIGLGIKKQRGANAVAVADRIGERLDTIRKRLPPGYLIQINFDSTRFIRHSIGEMKFTLLLSVMLTAMVCLFFLGSWGATFNVLLSIPTSIVGSFLFLYFFGFTLNTFTLLGLILAVGIVVDDAIMVLENIVRHQEMGKDAPTAASSGAREITKAAVATTIAIIAIFIPVAFMRGIIGKFFFQFGITMTVAVGLSLLEAITLTPMRASVLQKDKENRLSRFAEDLFQTWSKNYRTGLDWCLNNRGTVLGGSLGFFVLSLSLIFFLKKEFVPAQDQSMFLIRAQTPLGSSIDFTSEKLKEVEKIIANRGEVRKVYCAVGGFGGGEVNTGMLFVSLKEPKERPKDPKLKRRSTQADTMNALRAEFSHLTDLKIFLQDLSTRGFTAQRGFPVEFTVRGPEWNKLVGLSQALIEKMKQNPFFVDVDSDYQYGQPEIQILPRREAAATHGVSMDDLGDTIRALMGGIKEGKFTEGGHRNDIRVRLKEDARRKAEAIQGLYVRTIRGELVSLASLVEIRETQTLKSMTRKDRERAISVFSNVAPGKTQNEALKEVFRLAEGILPANYRIVPSGSAEIFGESFSSLVFALWLGVIVAYMVLGSQYNSFLYPVIVLLALPFSLSGAWIALMLTGHSLNIYSFIGIILLMGIVKKNSILLVDFTNRRRREGMDVTTALKTACPQRLRPILMTSFATMAAAVPPVLSLGPGAETRAPMAVVVIGGVLLSTFLTLFVVPCAYSLAVRFERKEKRLVL